MKKIRVLHLSSEKTWRGGEQQIAYLIEGLQALNVENFVAVRGNSEFHRYCINHKISHFPLRFKNSVDLKTAAGIKRLCADHNINIVHMHSSKSHGTGVLSAVLGNRIPMILSRRVDFTPGESWLTKWKYNHPSIRRIICVSHNICEMMKNYVSHPEKCITIHSGVDINKFGNRQQQNKLRREFHLGDATLIIGNTSALEDHKDYYTFIRTIEILQHKHHNLKAFIIGDGSLRDELTTYVRTKRLGDVITFTGFRTDINEIIPSLDFFLMTSKEEGLGTSILDAFVAGIPVVATSAGGIPEMVIHEKTGMLAPTGDAEQLASHLEMLINNPMLRQGVITGARQKVEEFSKETTAKKTLDVYHEIAVSDS